MTGSRAKEHFGVMSVAAVIFDLDGTLVDSLPDIADAMNRVLAHHQQPIQTHEAYRALIGSGIRSMINRLVRHCDSGHQRVLCDQFITRYSGHLFDKSVCCPGMVELVARLHSAGYTLAVFSNKRHELAKELVAHFFSWTISRWSGGTLRAGSANLIRSPPLSCCRTWLWNPPMRF